MTAEDERRKPIEKDDRTERVAAALRENLRKRKAQQRARAAERPDPDPTVERQ